MLSSSSISDRAGTIQQIQTLPPLSPRFDKIDRTAQRRRRGSQFNFKRSQISSIFSGY